MTNQIRIFACFISTLLLSGVCLQAQVRDTITNTSKRRNDTYGLRVGVDLKKITQTIIDEDYRGFEVVGDYRLTKKIYLAGEIGNEKNSLSENSISTTTDGSYIKAGIDYNVHKNLIGMRNLVYVGARYGVASFSQQLGSFSVATETAFFPSEQIPGTLDQSGLSAHWLEFLAGLKVEVLDRLFLGMSVAVQFKFIEDTPEGFDNLYIPGFGTTNDFSNFSAGFNYFISYYIPFYKNKSKLKKVKNLEQASNK